MESNTEIICTISIELQVLLREKYQKSKFENVKHVRKLSFQLIYISAVVKRGMRTDFDYKGSKDIRNREELLITTGSLCKWLYSLNVSKFSQKALLVSLRRWKERLEQIKFPKSTAWSKKESFSLLKSAYIMKKPAASDE